MKLFTLPRFFLLLTTLLGCGTAARSQVGADNQNVRPRGEALRVEGTVSVESAGAVLEARLQYQGPDTLKIEIMANPAANVGASYVVGSGDSTLIYDVSTRRVRRFPYNIAREPWRNSNLASGGPANLAIFEWQPKYFQTHYKDKLLGDGALELTARSDAPTRMTRDFIRTGGDRDSLLYATFKVPSFDWPHVIRIASSEGVPVARIEEAEKGRLLSSSSFEIDKTSKLPVSASIQDARKQTVATYKYSLKTRAAAFPAETFDLPATARNAIVEEDSLGSLSDYTGSNAPSDIFNRGMVQATYLEDYAAAFSSWDAASTSASQATAPLFATFDAALVTRDSNRGNEALTRLAAILGEKDFEIVSRRATLAVLARDWKNAVAALDAAHAAAPQNLTAALLRAGVLRSRGDVAGARAAWLQILSAPGNAQSDARIGAAEAIAQTVASREEANALLATIPSDNQWQLLARAHLALWQNIEPEIQKVPETIKDAGALASVALAYERERRDNDALKIWTELDGRTVGDANILIKSRLAVLNARRSDVASSVKAGTELLALVSGENNKRRERDLWFEAWRKAFKQSELQSALQNRALAGGANSDDLWTLLAFQENYSGADAVASTVQAASGRFSNSALWHSRQAEELLAEREGLPRSQKAARLRLFREALEEIETARTLDPKQLYYAMQYALVLVQLSAKPEMIVDIESSQANRKKAHEALDTVEREFPNDPDAALLVALGRNALSPLPTADTIAAIETALRSGKADDPARHATVFFVRQGIAMQWRKIKLPGEAAAQYEKLLDASISATEETGIALNYLLMLQELSINQAAAQAAQNAGQAGSPQTGVVPPAAGNNAARPATPQISAAPRDFEPQARLLERLAREPWPLADQSGLMNSVLPVLLRDRAGVIQLASYLMGGSPARKLVGTQLQFELERVFVQAASGPELPANIERGLREMQAAAQTASDSLEDIARGDDKILAVRALVLRAERASGVSTPAEAADYLRRAIELEGSDIGLRAALVDSLLAANKRDEALRARDAFLRELPRTPEVLRRAAILTQKLEQYDLAVRFAEQAVNMLQTSREGSPAQVEVASFVLARALYAAGQTGRSEELYRNLAGSQWDVADRAAALFDWQNVLNVAGKTGEAARLQTQIDALGASEDELNQARALIQGIA